MKQDIRARIFISCGQQKESDELQVAQDIAKKLTEMGFEPYIAVVEQTLKGLKENIYQRLSETEYFVFVDFKRERLFILDNGESKDTQKHRGSLFSHQELAIATYLGIDCITFQEKGLKEDDGILKFIQANCISFTDRHLLADVVARKVKERIDKKEWDPKWRNELSLHFLRQVPNVMTVEGRKLTDWYHLQVCDNHRSRLARNCMAYVSEIIDIDKNQYIDPGNFELVWSGTGLFQRHILPRRPAEVDAFLIFQDEDVIKFHHRASTSTQYRMPTLKKGNYLLTYLIASDNFEQVSKTFKLEFGGHYKDIKFGETN